ncbi:MAG: hypothetical protein QM831_27950 [Kofleriaceae bacterium]
MQRPNRVVIVFCLLLVAGCGRYWVCDPPESDLTQLPARLSDTGLDGSNVIAYTPRFALWSDGAEKQRWIDLPSPVDASNAESWSFPIGTKVWKQFSANGVMIETRLIERTASGWLAQSYAWLDDDSDAVAVPDGVANARGTGHDIPGAGECLACHGGRKSFVLGYAHVQLDDVAIAGDDAAVAAIGYLHANCSHCHNQDRPQHDGARCFDPENSYDFSYTASQQSIETNGITAKILDKITSRGFLKQMPPLATNVVDDQGVATIRAWFAELP